MPDIARYLQPNPKATLGFNYKERIGLGLAGLAVFMVLWEVIFYMKLLSPRILPSVESVISALMTMISAPKTWSDIGFSLTLNILGLLEAAIVSLPVGVFLSLIPGVRGMTERIIAAARYIPMTAATGVYIGIFGIYFNMKLQFLATSIMLFLIPQVIYLVDQVPQVLVDTAMTLGASKWQIVRRVYIRSILPDFFFAVVNLSAISWTYLVVAEMVNAQWGIGALAYGHGRQGRIPEFISAMLLIGVIGFFLDKGGNSTGKMIFSYKFKKKGE